MVVARDFAAFAGLRDMAEGERRQGQFGEMCAAKGNWAGIVVAFDPDPAAPCLKTVDPETVCLGKGAGRLEIVETVTKADHGARVGAVEIVFQPDQGIAGLVRGELRSVASGQTAGLSKVQIGHHEQAPLGPPERAGSRAR